MFGGYGGARHSRLGDLLAVDLLLAPTVRTLAVNGAAPSPRIFHSTCVVEFSTGRRCMLLVGGRAGPSEPLSDCYCLDMTTLCWCDVASVFFLLAGECAWMSCCG